MASSSGSRRSRRRRHFQAALIGYTPAGAESFHFRLEWRFLSGRVEACFKLAFCL